MNFKRIISLILAIFLIVGIMVGCGENPTDTPKENTQNENVQNEDTQDENTDNKTDSKEENKTENVENEDTQNEDTDNETNSEKDDNAGNNETTEKKMIKNKDLIKVLCIGHSFSNNSVQYASQMVADFGGNLEITSLYYAGCTLQQHYDFYNNDEAVFQLFTNGRQVTTEPVTSKWVLENHEYDYITFQGHSLSMDDIATYDKLVPLYEIVKKHQPNAKFMMHQTWSLCWRRNAGRGYRASKIGRDQFEKVEECFNIAAKRIGDVPIVPVGEAVQIAKESYGFSNDYGKSTSIYADEVSHLSSKGCYLAACVWAQFLYKDEIDVRENTYIGVGVNREEREKLAEVAYKVVME